MNRKLYPDDLAEKLKEHAGEKYRPSNGSEGMMFQDMFCNFCVHDREYTDNTPEKGCQILANTLFYDTNDPKYPPEWQYGPDGQPTCTKFCP